MEIEIRKATKEDYKEVIKLFGDFVENPKRYTKPDSNSYYKVLENPNAFIDLAVLDDKIIGFITYSKRDVVRYGSSIVEVEEFYVVPEYRRKGVGRKLKESVLKYAKKRNCQYIFLASSKEREIAHKFYKALKFDEYAFHYRRRP